MGPFLFDSISTIVHFGADLFESVSYIFNLRKVFKAGPPNGIAVFGKKTIRPSRGNLGKVPID
jgi:hypothetical protein